MRIVVLALTPLARDARVIRSAEALGRAGHDVVVVARQPLPEQGSYRVRPLKVMRSEAWQRAELVLTQAPAALAPRLAPALYWCGDQRRKMLRVATEERPDVVYCNDWLTLPVGFALKRDLG